MTFYLVLKFLLGMTIVGTYESEKECEQGAAQYMQQLMLERTDENPKHEAKMLCVQYEPPPFEAREDSKA